MRRVRRAGRDCRSSLWRRHGIAQSRRGDAPGPRRVRRASWRVDDQPRCDRRALGDVSSRHRDRRALQAAGRDRRRGHGHGLGGRADRAGPPPRGAQAHQAGHGQPAGAVAVRGRAAGAGADGPPEHRQGARRRHDRPGPPVLRDGVRQGRADHGVLRPGPAHAVQSASSCSCRSARRCSTRIRRESSTAI